MYYVMYIFIFHNSAVESYMFGWYSLRALYRHFVVCINASDFHYSVSTVMTLMPTLMF